VGGDYKKLDTVGQHVWGAPLDHMGVHVQPSSSECSEHSKCAAIIDSGTTLLTFPKSVVHSLYTAIEMGCSEADCLLTLQDQKECSGPHYNALPNLELRVGGVDLVLTPRVYMGEMDVDISAASMDETDGKGDRKIKNSHLDAGCKANHLSYIGDADLGQGVNVGAGTITANYDGLRKHRTLIGSGSKTGANSTLVAPVSLGAGATVGAGSVITRDVAAGALALGRARQVVKENWPGPA